MSDNTGSAKVPEKKDKATNEPSFSMEELQALAALVNEHGFTDFEFENENIRVRLSKQASVTMVPAPVNQSSQTTQAQSSEPRATPAEPGADADSGLHKIVSPIVGTFYRSPGPDKEVYVKEGSTVSPDTTVCIVEAMKLMNEIQAEVSGEIVKIYVENGQPVEYGQPLFGVRQ